MSDSDVVRLSASIATAVIGQGDLDAAIADLRRMPPDAPGRSRFAAGLLGALIESGRPIDLDQLREIDFLLTLADQEPPDGPLWPIHRRIIARFVFHMASRTRGLRGAVRALPLIELGESLAERYVQAGPGMPEAEPMLNGTIEALSEAYRYSESDTDMDGRIASLLGWALGTRHLAYGGPVEDRDEGIRLLDVSVEAPGLSARRRAAGRLTLGRLLFARATAGLPDGAQPEDPERQRDTSRAYACLRRVLTDPATLTHAMAALREPPFPQTSRPGTAEPGGAPPPPVEAEQAVPDIREGLGEPPVVEPDDQRLLVGSFPTHAPLGAEVSLIVRIVREDRALHGSRFTMLRPMVIGPRGATVTFTVESAPGLTVLGPTQYQVHVPADADSDPVRFAFRCDRTNSHSVWVKAWAGGTFLGELVFEVSVSVGGPSAGPCSKSEPTGPITSKAGEVTLRVLRDGDAFQFQLLSAGHDFEPVIRKAMAAGSGTAVNRAIANLQKLARGNAGYDPGNARALLLSTGVALWTNMVPEAIKEQFWELRPRITTFAIDTGLDDIPWELLYPVSPTEDEGFLVEQFAVTRRVFGQARVREISLRPARFVVPEGGPRNAGAEVEAVHRILSGTGTPETVKDLAALLALVEAGDIGLMHFACHNTYRPEDGSSITMAGGDFVPDLLEFSKARKVLAPARPLVFVNACRSAGAVPHFTRMMSWAEQFLGAGAGAFVGTLWDIRSSGAQTFAEAFYDAFATGSTLGQATLRARNVTAAAEGDPTWLSYAVYGDPHAVSAHP